MEDIYTPMPTRLVQSPVQDQSFSRRLSTSAEASTPEISLSQDSSLPIINDGTGLRDSDSTLRGEFQDQIHNGDHNIDKPTPLEHPYGFRNRESSDVRSVRRTSSSSTCDSSDTEDMYSVMNEDVDLDDTFLGRIKGALRKFAAEPKLITPPPSPPISRKNSLSDWDSDMVARAMRMNEGRLLDIDDPRLDSPPAGLKHRLPFFLRFRGHRNAERPELTRQSSGLNQQQGRKTPRHRIVLHPDSEDAQRSFVLILSKALLVVGAPSHRIESQLNSIVSAFGLEAQFLHTPGCVQISFGKAKTKTPGTVLVRATSGLLLSKIHGVHEIYRAVVRDECSASEGQERIEALLKSKALYSVKLLYFVSFFLGSFLCGISFGGSLNDMWVSGMLAVFVMFMQRSAAQSDLSASGSDIFSAAVVSFTARALSTRVPNNFFCYQAISSAGVAGLLPGSVILAGVLDIATGNSDLGAPKVTAGLLTSLYMGFGLTLGSDLWLQVDGSGRRMLEASLGTVVSIDGTFHAYNATNSTAPQLFNLPGTFLFDDLSHSESAAAAHMIHNCYRSSSAGWYLQPLPWWSLFVLLPVYNVCSSMKRGQHLRSRQMVAMVTISCISSGLTRYANIKLDLQGHPDYVSLIGSFIVSVLGNLYSRNLGGTAFTVMLTGILLLIPTGLAGAGGLANTYTGSGQDEYTNSLDLARKMISVIMGVMSGVYLSEKVVYAYGKKKNSALVTF